MPGKLQVPGVPPSFVERPRINALLDRGAAGRVTLVCAPAGWGKTTAVAGWVAARRRAGVSWLTLDEADNDPARLRADLHASLSRLAPAVLVLDRVERIVADGAAEALAQLVTEIRGDRPPALGVVVCARADPRLPLAALRRAGQLTEIRTAELAFTPAEALALLDRRGVPPAPADRLVEQAGGWAAALCLDPDRLAAYLRREVLDDLPPELRGFLLTTSVVDRLCGGLARAVCGSPGAERLLAQLAARGLVAGDAVAPQCWYRLHPPLREFVRREARAAIGHELADMHLRAARWWTERGRPDEAVDHAVAADGFGYVAPVSARARAGPAAGVLVDLAEIGVMRQRGDHSGVARRGSEAVARLDTAVVDSVETTEQLRAVAQVHAGVAQLWCGLLDTAARLLEQGGLMAARYGHGALAADALGHRALLSALRGRLCDADDRALAAVRSAPAGKVPAMAHLALAVTHLERADLDAAAGHLDLAGAGTATGAEAGAVAALLRARLGPSTGMVAGPGPSTAPTAGPGPSTGMVAAQEPHPPPLLRAWRSVLEAEALIAAGRPDQALAGLSGLLRTRTLDPLTGPAHVAAARAHLARQAPARARSILAPLHAPGASVGIGVWIEAWLVDALAAAELDLPGAVSVALGQALAAAEPEGYRRPFLACGPALTELLARYPDVARPYREFVDALPAPVNGKVNGRLPESITEREAVVLRYLPTLLTAHEIAGELCVSQNTVKTQLKSIYRKLDVRSRRAAVDRARRLGLLPRG